MSTISGDGATQAIYLQMSGADVQYSVGTPLTWITINSGEWPVTITNTAASPGPSTILRVVVTQDLTLSSNTDGILGYFIAGSTYITFDGSGNTITMDTIALYPGFIQNGLNIVNGNANIVVQNFTTDTSGASTLAINAGWLCQGYFGKGCLGTSITGCTNNGAINSVRAGGLIGIWAGLQGSLTITNCTNNGEINSQEAGGLIGQRGGSQGSLTITNCTNNGTISGIQAGGIAGGQVGLEGDSSTLTGCTSNGLISGNGAGGIIGSYAGFLNGSVTCMNCTSSGVISGSGAGGIAGAAFAFDTSKNCIISQCYSMGNISGNSAGGITGSDIGGCDASYNALVDIINCYSLGTIAVSAGGICGGLIIDNYQIKPTIQITNSYSSGAITAGGQGLVAPSLTATQINLTTPNTYVANGTWSDTNANANLLGYPTDVSTNNPGSNWATIISNTPYLLSSYNAQIYNPSSASSRYNYTTNPGLFQPGYNYTLLRTSQYYEEATAYVFVSKGTSPKYYSYNFNRFDIVNSSGSENPIGISINSSNGVLNFIMPFPCFLEGTKILCFENNQEVYRQIETLRKGDLVKTIYNGYLPIYMIGTSPIYNPGNDYRVTNRLYKCPKEKYPGLIEDLYITGCHSILVPSMTDDQWENTKAVHKEIYITDNHFRLIACADEKAEPYNKEGFMNIYHIALEHEDYYMNYGIYANGLLVESCSKRYLMEFSNITLFGEEDCAISEEVHIHDVSNVIRQLVDTY